MHICNEAGDWFQWDLRYTAVSLDRQVHSVLGLQTYLNRVGDEIARACADGRLRCSSSPVLATGLPPLDQIPIAPIFSYTGSGLWQMARDQLPVGTLSSGKPTPAQYALWRSVVAGMPSEQSLGARTGPAAENSLLRALVVIYGILNLILLAAVVLGMTAWIVQRVTRRAGRDHRIDRMAACSAAFFLASTLVGMTMLAVFAAALGGGGYTAYYYWVDFAAPGELVLVFGAIAVWPVLRGLVTPGRQAASDPPVADHPTRIDELAGVSAH